MPLYSHPSTYVVWSQTTHKKPSAQIRTSDAEDTFERLNSHDQAFTLNHHLEFGTNALLQKLRNLDLSLSPRLSLRRDHYGFEFDWGAWTHWIWHQSVWGHWSKVQRDATTTQGTMRMLLCRDEIPMEKKNLPSIIPLCQLIISNLISTNKTSDFVQKKSSCTAKLQCLISSNLLGRVHRQLECW
jgi:hypothetical protein